MSSTKTKIYIIGQFNNKEIFSQLEKTFGDWFFGQGHQAKSPKITSQNTWSMIDRQGAHQSTMKIAMHISDFSIKDYTPLIVVNALLGGTFISRITTNIREDKGYSYSPISQLSIDRKYCFWTQTADVSTEVTVESLKEIFLEINKLTRYAPSFKELDGMVAHLSGLHIIRFSTPRSIIAQLFFADKIGIKRSFFESYITNLRQLTPEFVHEQINRSFNKEYFIAVAGDKKIVYEEISKLKQFKKIKELIF